MLYSRQLFCSDRSVSFQYLLGRYSMAISHSVTYTLIFIVNTRVIVGVIMLLKSNEQAHLDYAVICGFLCVVV